jgi:hypothetical protein
MVRCDPKGDRPNLLSVQDQAVKEEEQVFVLLVNIGPTLEDQV